MDKAHTIKKNQEFENIMKTGKRNNNQFFTLYTKKPETINYRIGISVPKKLGNAVLRNKIKRQVKTILHDLSKEFPIQQDCIIIINRPFLELSFFEKKEAIYEQKKNLE